MLPEQEEEFRDGEYRAIGRYVVEFSRLCAFMRHTLAFSLCQGSEPPILQQLALGEQTANQTVNAFFAVCQTTGRAEKRLDATEQKIGRMIRSKVIDEIERRNDIAHGDWYIGHRGLAPTHPVSVLLRVKPARGERQFADQDVTAADLDEWSDSLAALTLMVAEFGHIALGIDTSRRVSDVFAIEKKTLVRVA